MGDDEAAILLGQLTLDEAIRRAHDASYVEAISNNTLDTSLWRRVGFVARPDHALLMRRTRLEIAGTLRARDLALKHGLACHLGGGTHHAHETYGSGYTIYNDLAVAALDTCVDPKARVLVVDLDVHQGDGTAQILEGHDRCYTWSVHCDVNFPFGFSEKHAPHLGKDRSSLDTALERGSGDAEMLDAISENLPTILDSFEPTLVLYDAGADAHEVDGLGHLELTDAGMLARDAATGKVVCAGGKDAQGRAIIWVRLRLHNPRECSAEDMARLVVTVMCKALEDVETQRRGIVMFSDGLPYWYPYSSQPLFIAMPSSPVTM